MREPMTEERANCRPVMSEERLAWIGEYIAANPHPGSLVVVKELYAEVRRVRQWGATANVELEVLQQLYKALAERADRLSRALNVEREQWHQIAADRNTATKRADQTEIEAARLRTQLAEAATLLGHFVDHEDQPCRLNHHGACQEHGGSSLRRCDVAAGREWLALVRESNGGPGCLCPHTYQPDGALVRDGVLAVGCPVHDPDAREDGDA